MRRVSLGRARAEFLGDDSWERADSRECSVSAWSGSFLRALWSARSVGFGRRSGSAQGSGQKTCRTESEDEAIGGGAMGGAAQGLRLILMPRPRGPRKASHSHNARRRRRGRSASSEEEGARIPMGKPRAAAARARARARPPSGSCFCSAAISTQLHLTGCTRAGCDASPGSAPGAWERLDRHAPMQARVRSDPI